MKVTFRESINIVLDQVLSIFPNSILIGEDIGKLGGVFRITSSLQEKYGERRVINSILSESGIVGTSIGMVLAGGRVICEIQFDGFLYAGLEQILTQLSRLYFKNQGKISIPIIIRIPIGGNNNALEYHNESPESILLASPGMRIIAACKSKDSLFIPYLIERNSPSIFFEYKNSYSQSSNFEISDSFLSYEFLSHGDDLTIVAYGSVIYELESIIEEIQSKYRVTVDLMRLVLLYPLQVESILNSVKRTRSLIIIHESRRWMGYGGEIASYIYSKNISLKRDILRIGSYNTQYPPSRLEKYYYPNKEYLKIKIEEYLSNLK